MLLPFLALIVGSQQAAPPLESRAQALSSDERLFAYAVTDGTVRIATLPAGKVRVLASGLSQVVEGLAFSPDGTRLASVAHDGSVRMFECADGKFLGELPAGTALLPVWSRPTIDYVDDGAKLLLTGGQSRARLLDAASGAVVSEFLAGPESKLDSESTLRAVAVSRDRMHFTVGDATGTVSVRSAHTGAIESGPFRIPGVLALDFDPNATVLASGATDGRVRILALDKPTEPVVLSQPDDDFWGPFGSSIGSVRFGADPTKLFTTSFERGVIRRWDLSRKTVAWQNETTDIPDADAATCRLAGEPPVLVVAHSGMVFDSASGLRIGTLGTKFGAGQYAVAGPYAWLAASGSITIVEPRERKLVCALPLAPAPPPQSLMSYAQAFSRDEKFFAYAVNDGSLRVAEFPSGKARCRAGGLPPTIQEIAWSADGGRIAALTREGRVLLLDGHDCTLLGQVELGDSDLKGDWGQPSIEFVDGEKRLLVSGGRSRAQLLESESLKLVKEVVMGSAIRAQAISFDHRHFALGGQDGAVVVHSCSTGDIETGPFSVPLTVHSLDFDRAGERLAIGAGDCTARVYSLKSKAKPLEFSHCDEDLMGDLAIGAVRFSSDGRKLLTTSFTWWEVRLWDIENGNEIWRFEFDGGNPIPLVASFGKDSTVVISSALTNQLSWRTVLDLAQGRRLHGFGEGVGDGGYFYCKGGDYAWVVSPSTIAILEPRTGKVACEISLVVK